MIGPSNADRASWAQAGLSAFAELTGQDEREPFGEVLGDLMADALHLAAQLGEPFGPAELLAAAQRAVGHYVTEVREENDDDDD